MKTCIGEEWRHARRVTTLPLDSFALYVSEPNLTRRERAEDKTMLRKLATEFTRKVSEQEFSPAKI
jgi:hypothetical protein